MTQRNIDVMDVIVTKVAEEKSLSKALKSVYSKRSVAIPFRDEMFDVNLNTLHMSMRTTNALITVGAKTINDVLRIYQNGVFDRVRNFGKTSRMELLETILDYCWNHMDTEARASFLIDTVERNSNYIRSEIAI